MKKETIIKCEAILDVAFLCTYVFVVVYSMLKTASFPVEWPNILTKIENCIFSAWLVYAAYKLYVNFTYDIKKTLLAMLLLIGAIVSANWELSNYLYIVVPMIIAYRMNFDRIAKAYAIAVCFTLLVLLVLSMFGIISAYTYNQFSKTDQLLHLLGFGNSNTYMGYWLFAVLAMLYMIRERNEWIAWIIGILSYTGILYYLTHSRTSAALIVMLCLIFCIWKLMDRLKWQRIKGVFWKVFAPLMIPIPVYVLALTVLLVLFYNLFQYNYGGNSFLFRAHDTDILLESLGVQLPNNIITPSAKVGIPFNWIIGTGTYDYGGKDMLYTNLFAWDGLIVLIPYLLFQVLFMYKAYKQRDFMVFTILSAINILSLMEAWPILIDSSVFFLMFFADWGKDNEKV